MALLTQRAAAGKPPSLGIVVLPRHKHRVLRPSLDPTPFRYGHTAIAVAQIFPIASRKFPLFQREHEVVLNVLASLATTCNVANGVLAVGVGSR